MTSATFWVLSALLAAVALAILVVPLWRARREQGQWSTAALVVSIAIVPLTVGLYFSVTTWEPDAALDVRDGPAAMVAQLAQRLQANPDDVHGWQLLGRSYHALGQYQAARQAFREAWQRTPEPDNDLKLYYGETLVLTDPDALQGQAGRLFEEVLAVEPSNPTALWWGGLAAVETGRPDLARERWMRLLAFNPPDDVVQQLQALLAVLPGGDQPTQLAPSGDGIPDGEDAAAAARIQVSVNLGEGVPLSDFTTSGALFVFVRIPGERPPLAAIRRPIGELPDEFVLSDADAMLPGRSLADFDELTIVARLSASGDATERAGDYFGQASFSRGDDDVVHVTIDRRVE